MNTRQIGEVIFEVLAAVERRDTSRFTEPVHPGFEIVWPPSLRYTGWVRGTALGTHRRPAGARPGSYRSPPSPSDKWTRP